MYLKTHINLSFFFFIFSAAPQKERSLLHQTCLGVGLGILLGAFFLFFLDLNLITYVAAQRQYIIDFCKGVAGSLFVYTKQLVGWMSDMSIESVSEYLDITWVNESGHDI